MSPQDDIYKNLEWLSREAPRYTSYPSAHHFQDFTPNDHKSWLSKLSTEESVAVYVHIPFCPQLCWFCGCNTKATRRYKPVGEYIDLLLEEFRLLAKQLKHKLKVHNIHFGGGSPTILSPEDLTRIFYAIESSFIILPNAEISIEIDPRQLTSEKAKAYSLLGFNRASIGVQDFDTKVQEVINRIQPYTLVEETFSMLRENGIQNINADLVYGLPYQTSESITNTAKNIIKLNPNRIAYFSYAHVPWIKKHQRLVPIELLPDIKTKATHYLSSKRILESSGYISIGMDHFTKTEDTLYQNFKNNKMHRNFMGYSDLPNNNIIGIGISSVSESEHGLCQNTSKADEYKKSILSGVLPIMRGLEYTGEDNLRREVISLLMCYFEVNLEDLLFKYNYPEIHFDHALQNLAEFEEAGIISINKRTIRFNSELKMLIRPVCMAFDQYATIQGKKYSKVV